MDIFVINTIAADNVSSELLEQFRYKNFSNEKKKKEHCFAYLMTDRILKDVYKIEKREIEHIKEKPYLKTREKYFSISHSGDCILIAFSDNECGADIELMKKRDYRAISERMQFDVSTLTDFYAEWTKYEAEYKLGAKYKSIFQNHINNYMITAVSSDSQEIFEIYIQNGEEFSNVNTPIS